MGSPKISNLLMQENCRKEGTSMSKMKDILKKGKQRAKYFAKDLKETVSENKALFIAGGASVLGVVVSIFAIRKGNQMLEDGIKECFEEAAEEMKEDFVDGTIVSDGEEIDGAWFTTEKGGRIFFAKDSDGNLP